MNFETLQQKIQKFIEKISSREDIFFIGEKLPLSDALFCGGDSMRNRKIYEAIGEAIKDMKTRYNDIQVIDAGAGIGVLGIFALFQGAQHAIFIEENTLTAQVLEEFLQELGLLSQSTIICGDALEVENISQSHILISETIALDFSEDFIDIVSHLSSFLGEDGIILPEGFELDVVNNSSKKELSFSSYRLPDKQEFQFPSGTTISGKCYLYGDISIQSGECMSFCNERVVK